jgi:hypothetical protein
MALIVSCRLSTRRVDEERSRALPILPSHLVSPCITSLPHPFQQWGCIYVDNAVGTLSNPSKRITWNHCKLILPSWSSNNGWVGNLEGRFEGRPFLRPPAYPTIQAIASYCVGVAKWRRGGKGSLGLLFVTPTVPNTVDCCVQIGEEMKWGSFYPQASLGSKNRISQKHVS